MATQAQRDRYNASRRAKRAEARRRSADFSARYIEPAIAVLYAATRAQLLAHYAKQASD